MIDTEFKQLVKSSVENNTPLNWVFTSDSRYQSALAEIRSESTSVAVSGTAVAVAEPEDRGATDREISLRTLALMAEGKTDVQIKQSLLDEFEDIEPDVDEFIRKARQEFANEVELARQSEDEIKKAAAEIDLKREKAEFEAKKRWVEVQLLNQNKRVNNNWTAAEWHQMYVELKWVQDRQLEWREPKPINAVPDVQQFDLKFLPVSIRPRVQDVAQRTSTPLDFAGIASVLCLAGVTGRRVFVYPMRNNKEWREAIALSGVIVAQSGKTKTPVWKAFTDPIIENDAEWREEHSRAMKVYKVRSDGWESQEKAARKTGAAFELPKPEGPPKQRRCTINDATPEALHSAMQDNPEGYLYYRDELSGFVEELDAPNRESQRTLFMTAMDGDNTYTMQRIGRGEVSARMCASVCGNFQPNRLEAFLNNARNIEDGLVPRFTLMVYPQSEFHGLNDKTADEKAKMVYRSIVRQLAKMKASTVEVHFNEEAQQVFTEWLEGLMRRIDREDSEWIRSHLSKYKGALPKLAALFQLVDLIAAIGETATVPISFEPGAAVVESQPVIGNRVFIDRAHLDQAMHFLDYLESHMYKIYNSVKSPLSKAESALSSRIKDGSLRSGFTFRDITRKNWRGLNNPEIVREAIESLEQAHWIRPSKPEIIPAKGRPKAEGWDINPALTGETNGTA